MTTLISKILGAAALCLLLACPAAANEGHYKDGMDDTMLDSALGRLDLSSDQKERLRAARRDHREKMGRLVERKEELLNRLRTQVDNRASDSDLRGTLGDLKEVKKDMEEQREDFHEDLEEILTPTQKAKMVLEKMDKKKKRPTDRR